MTQQTQNRETHWVKDSRERNVFVVHAITVHIIDYKTPLETYYKHTFSSQIFSSRKAMRSDLAAAILRARRAGIRVARVWHFERSNNVNPHGLI